MPRQPQPQTHEYYVVCPHPVQIDYPKHKDPEGLLNKALGVSEYTEMPANYELTLFEKFDHADRVRQERALKGQEYLLAKVEGPIVKFSQPKSDAVSAFETPAAPFKFKTLYKGKLELHDLNPRRAFYRAIRRHFRVWTPRILGVTALSGVTGFFAGPSMITAFKGLGLASFSAQSVTTLICYAVGLVAYIALSRLFNVVRRRLAMRGRALEDIPGSIPYHFERMKTPKPAQAAVKTPSPMFDVPLDDEESRRSASFAVSEESSSEIEPPSESEEDVEVVVDVPKVKIELDDEFKRLMEQLGYGTDARVIRPFMDALQGEADPAKHKALRDYEIHLLRMILINIPRMDRANAEHRALEALQVRLAVRPVPTGTIFEQQQAILKWQKAQLNFTVGELTRFEDTLRTTNPVGEKIKLAAEQIHLLYKFKKKVDKTGKDGEHAAAQKSAEAGLDKYLGRKNRRRDVIVFKKHP